MQADVGVRLPLGRRKILLVERGNRYSPLQDMNDNEMEMLQKLYKEGGLQLTKKFDMMILQGEAVGGTTVINNAVCLQMPPEMKSVWENQYGIDMRKQPSALKIILCAIGASKEYIEMLTSCWNNPKSYNEKNAIDQISAEPTFNIEDNTLAIVPPHVIHSSTYNAKPIGYFIRFNADFFLQQFSPVHLLQQLL